MQPKLPILITLFLFVSLIPSCQAQKFDALDISINTYEEALKAIISTKFKVSEKMQHQ